MTKIKLNNLEISQEDLIEELESNPEIMEKLQEKFGKKESGWFVPKINELFLFLDEAGDVCSSGPYNSHHNDKILKSQQVFRTKQEAQQASLRQQAKIRILKTIAEENAKVGWVCDWNNLCQSRSYLAYETNDKKVRCYSTYSYREHETDFYFSPEIENIILEKCAEDYKLYLNIK